LILAAVELACLFFKIVVAQVAWTQDWLKGGQMFVILIVEHLDIGQSNLQLLQVRCFLVVVRLDLLNALVGLVSELGSLSLTLQFQVTIDVAAGNVILLSDLALWLLLLHSQKIYILLYFQIDGFTVLVAGG
jgi:hypothetical protein